MNLTLARTKNSDKPSVWQYRDESLYWNPVPKAASVFSMKET